MNGSIEGGWIRSSWPVILISGSISQRCPPTVQTKIIFFRWCTNTFAEPLSWLAVLSIIV